MIHEQYYVEKAKLEKLIATKNQKSSFYNGIYDRYEYPVLTREHIPVFGNMTWRKKQIHTLWNDWASTQ